MRNGHKWKLSVCSAVTEIVRHHFWSAASRFSWGCWEVVVLCQSTTTKKGWDLCTAWRIRLRARNSPEHTQIWWDCLRSKFATRVSKSFKFFKAAWLSHLFISWPQRTRSSLWPEGSQYLEIILLLWGYHHAVKLKPGAAWPLIYRLFSFLSLLK